MTGLTLRSFAAGIFAVGVSLAGADSAAAQADLLGPGAVYVGAGISSISTEELDDRLDQAGYPTFGGSTFGLSIGGYRIFGNGFMLGLEGNGLIMGEEEQDGREVGLGGGYGTLGLGYMFDVSRRARVYPRIGLGGGGMGMWFEDEEVEVDFDQVLANPQPTPDREPVLSTAGFVVDLGMGAEVRAGRRGAGPLVGLRFGYVAAPFNAEWWLNEHPVADDPNSTIEGPYIRAIFGLGWRR